MSLQKKSLTELRGIAQAMGMESKWDIGREALITEIEKHLVTKIQPPTEPIRVDITQAVTGPQLSPADVTKALEGFFPLGLKLTFPDDRTWQLNCNKRTDSGTLAMPMWNIIQCAKDMVKP